MQPDNQTACQEQLCPGPTGIGGVIPSKPNYEININRVENGFIVRVGCKIFCFAEWVLASEALALWFKNPEEAMKQYCKV